MRAFKGCPPASGNGSGTRSHSSSTVEYVLGRKLNRQGFQRQRRISYGQLRSFLVAMLLLATRDLQAQQPKTSASGVIYLLKADRADTPSRDLATQACWTNSHVDGVLLRTYWNKIQPRAGKIDWAFFDKGIALAAQYHKKLGLLVTAGVTTPDWVYAAGARQFAVSNRHNPNEPAVLHQPLPWDSVFKEKWGQVIREFGARYDSNPQVAYVVMGGSGRKAESFFASAPADVAAFNRIDGLASWKPAVKWITDQYAQSFRATPFLLDLGAPVPGAQGRAALAEVCEYGAKAYPHRFGVKSDGLGANYDLASFGAKEVSALSGKTAVGFQMSVPSKGKTNPQGRSLLADALKRGIGLGAHFIEVYAVDCNSPLEADNLEAASTELKKIGSGGSATDRERGETDSR